MPEKKIENKHAHISRILRCMFNDAAVGEEHIARRRLAEAIALGYVPNPKTLKGLEIAIKKGLRDVGRPTRHGTE